MNRKGIIRDLKKLLSLYEVSNVEVDQQGQFIKGYVGEALRSETYLGLIELNKKYNTHSSIHYETEDYLYYFMKQKIIITLQ